MGYSQISVKRKIVCSGDRRHKINIGSRTLSATNDGKPQYVFSTLLICNAMIDTVEPDDNFDSISLGTDTVSHVFYVGHIKAFDVDVKHVIKFEGNYYRVLKVMNSEEANITDIIYCAHKGSILKPGTDW